MNHGKRPGGLTAMAVINFVFGGFGALGFLGLIVFLLILTGTVTNEDTQKVKESFEEAGLGAGFLAFLLSVQLLAVVLLITSGVGYLKQKRVLGRYLGNTYALVSISVNLISALMMPGESGGFNLGTVIGLIYPVLTLFMLNTTFKEDLVN